MMTNASLAERPTPIVSGSGDYAVIPDDAPVVSMDARLGKKYSDVSFDYRKFAIQADEMGISPEDASQLSVHIKNRRSPWILHESHGNYRAAEKRIGIHIRRKMDGLSGFKTNDGSSTLRHEMNHAYEDIEGQLNINSRYVVGAIGARSLVALANTPTAITTNLAAAVSEKHVFTDILTAQYGMIAVGSLMFYYGYYRHPEEVRARQVQEQDSLLDVITQVPKPTLLNRILEV